MYKKSNYIQCRLCLHGWYVKDNTPMVVIGYTEPFEVDKYYLDHLEEKDLSKKKFTRCEVCHDLIEKRKHFLCIIKFHFKQVAKRHFDTIERIKIVVLGFWK